MRYQIQLAFVFCILFSMSGNRVAGQSLGSGDISGVFTDDVSTGPAPVIVTTDASEIFQAPPVDAITPISEGAGSSSYGWGIDVIPNRYILDGTVISLDEIFDIGLENLSGVLTREYELSTNRLAFSSNGFADQGRGETFVAGLLEYSNGITTLGSEVPSVTLTLNSTSSNPDFIQELELEISLVTVPNSGDEFGNLFQVASADFIFFTDYPEFGSFRVFENESTSVQVLAEFNSLDLVGFGQVTDPSIGFLSSSTSVPEPAGTSLMAMLGGVVFARRRRKQ